MEYLTTTKLRNMGLGTRLPTSDAELRSLIRISSGLVNREIAAPRTHDLRGGSVVNEQHPWDIGNDHIPGQRRLWPYHRPVNAVDRFVIRVTQGSSGVVNFPAEQIYINAQENYLELVSLSLTTASVYAAGLIPNIGLQKPVVELDYSYGWEYSVTDEELAAADSGGILYAADNQFWTDADVEVKVDGSVQGSGFTVDRTEGTITFSPAIDPDDPVTASYTHKLHPDIQMATALVSADVAAQTKLNAGGLQGLSGLRVLEVEIRQSRTAGFVSSPVNLAAAKLLEPFRYRSFM